MESNVVPTATQWRKSSYSGDEGGQCVEIAELPSSPTLLIRDSKNPAGPHLTLGPAAFVCFLGWASTASE
ncbi:DUF397 domain-containing protein [Streptomyces neyagawaensis]|uniref:DUF397 domain-containing protein n=1 Tax=Streptomyces neyagawaensis TaxID=42238 RepID=A0ABV3ASX3_9ACTN